LPLSLNEAEIDEVVERTAGVTASFVKELLRRAALEALTEGDGSLDQVTAAHVSRALDDLLESGQSVTRALLAVQDGGEPQPPRPGRSSAGHGGAGWMHAGGAYYSSLHIHPDNP
jgi:hypothetical protein